MSAPRTNPDPEGLAKAREIQRHLPNCEVILQGSRATGDHRLDSDIDLMAVAPNGTAQRETNEILRVLLEGKRDIPVVNVTTMTREGFQQTAPIAQSQAGRAARHGVTPQGAALDHTPDRDPAPGEIRQATLHRLASAARQLRDLITMSEKEHTTGIRTAGLEGQHALERAFRGLLTAGNDNARFRRDAALMWQHVRNAGLVSDRAGAKRMEGLLKGTTHPEQQGCSLTGLSQAFRRGDPMPELGETEQKAVRQHLAPSVQMLIAEALTRSGSTREELEQAKQGPVSGAPWWTW